MAARSAREQDDDALLQIRLDSMNGQTADDDDDVDFDLLRARNSSQRSQGATCRLVLLILIAAASVIAIIAAVGIGPFKPQTPEYRQLATAYTYTVPTVDPQKFKEVEEYIVEQEWNLKKFLLKFNNTQDADAYYNKMFGPSPADTRIEKLPRGLMDYDATFYDTFREGSIELPSGMELNMFQNVCVGVEFAAVIARDDQDYWQYKFCCESDEIAKHNCTTKMMAKCHASYAKDLIATEFWHPANESIREYMWLPGTTWWMYVPGKSEHIGHNINRMLQLFHARMDPHVPRFDWIFSNRMKLPNMVHNLNVVRTILGDMFPRTFLRKPLENLPKPVVCLERAIEVDTGMHERTFFTKEQAAAWRQYSYRNFHPEPKRPLTECPPPKAVILGRTQGTGLRKILNYDVVERVLKRNGIETYHNVSVSGEDDTAGHVRVFSDFGLMIASHSSQLKNLIFAPKNSIVLELRGTPTGYLEPSPFYWGTTEMDIVFELSQDHTPDLSSCPEAHGCTVIKRYKTDYWVVEEIFERSLRRALERQRQRCGDIWSQDEDTAVLR